MREICKLTREIIVRKHGAHNEQVTTVVKRQENEILEGKASPSIPLADIPSTTSNTTATTATFGESLADVKPSKFTLHNKTKTLSTAIVAIVDWDTRSIAQLMTILCYVLLLLLLLLRNWWRGLSNDNDGEEECAAKCFPTCFSRQLHLRLVAQCRLCHLRTNELVEVLRLPLLPLSLRCIIRINNNDALAEGNNRETILYYNCAHCYFSGQTSGKLFLYGNDFRSTKGRREFKDELRNGGKLLNVNALPLNSSARNFMNRLYCNKINKEGKGGCECLSKTLLEAVKNYNLDLFIETEHLEKQGARIWKHKTPVVVITRKTTGLNITKRVLQIRNNPALFHCQVLNLIVDVEEQCTFALKIAFTARAWGKCANLRFCDSCYCNRSGTLCCCSRKRCIANLRFSHGLGATFNYRDPRPGQHSIIQVGRKGKEGKLSGDPHPNKPTSFILLSGTNNSKNKCIQSRKGTQTPFQFAVPIPYEFCTGKPGSVQEPPFPFPTAQEYSYLDLNLLSLAPLVFVLACAPTIHFNSEEKGRRESKSNKIPFPERKITFDSKRLKVFAQESASILLQLPSSSSPRSLFLCKDTISFPNQNEATTTTNQVDFDSFSGKNSIREDFVDNNKNVIRASEAAAKIAKMGFSVSECFLLNKDFDKR